MRIGDIVGRARIGYPAGSATAGPAKQRHPTLMQDPSPSRTSTQTRHKTVLERLSAFIFREPENRADLLTALQDAHDRSLLDADALSMMEGVLQVSELRALDLMVPRSQMDVIDLSEPPRSWLPRVIDTAHSRFPVIEGNRDQVLGVDRKSVV